MAGLWSIEEYCSKQSDLLNHHGGDDGGDGVPTADDNDDYWSTLLGDNDNKNNRRFLIDLNLPTVHPFCLNTSNSNFNFNNNNGIPPMGSLNLLEEIKGTGNGTGGYSWLEAFITLWYHVAPALLAMAELWLRLFAGLFGPIGVAYLAYSNINIFNNKNKTKAKSSATTTRSLPFAIILTVSSSLILMTDTLYVLENGTLYGSIFFLVSIILSLRLCLKHNLRVTSVIVFIMVLLSIHLVTTNENENGIENIENNNKNCIHFGNPVDDVHLAEGLYHDSDNSLVSKIVKRWPKKYQMYGKDHDATTWMPTGDSRTGLPFIIHKYHPDEYPTWIRVFLEVQDDDDDDDASEYIALDISFPKKTGHDRTKPIYFVLHGLQGGSAEEYIRDLTIRRNSENSTVIVMIARGLMDTPIQGWNVFHGARTSDAHAAASTIRRQVLGDQQVLVGAGYSMGAIILSNYVASYGRECALDAAVAVSGGLDMRYQEHAFRAQRLWQPMLAGTLRDKFLLGKFGHRLKEKLSPFQFLKMMRATHITEIDRYGVVPMNGFDDLDHYYREMSALGDIPHDPVTDKLLMNNNGKIHDVSIPFLVVQAFDDPLITWRATAQNSGFMHPDNLVKSGNGNLMLLLTKAGGHVGWSLGLWPTKNKWRWMSDIVMSFARSVDEAKKEIEEEK